MKNRNQIELEDNFIDQRVAEAFGYGDEQLENELDDAVAAAEENGCRAPEGELERIVNLLEDRSVPRRKVIRIRRVVKMLAVAAVLGTMIFGGGMWVGAKRYYVQDVRDRSNLMVISNDPSSVKLDKVFEKNKIYSQIEDELGIEAMELSYLPDKMIIYNVTISKQKSIIEFNGGEKNLFFYQGLREKPSSFGFASDSQKFQKAYNLYFDEEFPIYEEKLENGKTEFGVRIVQDKVYYLLYGVMDIEEFKQVVYGIRPYEKYLLED